MQLRNTLFALLGAAVGGFVGYLGFFWCARQGFYALVLPGGLLGLGAGLSRNPPSAVAFLCGLSALTLGFFTEWRFAPFVTDPSFAYFLSHFHQLKPVTLILIALGGLIGFWVPFRR